MPNDTKMNRMMILLVCSHLFLSTSFIGGQPFKQEPPATCRLGLRLDERADEGSMRQIGPTNVQTRFSVPNGDEDVIRIETDLVISEFDVRDRRGRRVAGLSAADFIVEEDGVPQKIEIFSDSGASSVVGRSIILIIDYSNSQSPYIATSIAAAKTLVSMLEANDRMAIVTDDIELLTNFTSDKAVLYGHLTSLLDRSMNGEFGASKQMTAMFRAVDELFDRAEKRPVVIFQTDGDEFLLIGYGQTRTRAECLKQFRHFDQLEKLLRRSGTTVHSIIPGPRVDNIRDRLGIAEARAAVESELKAILTAARGPSHMLDRQITPRFVKEWMQRKQRDSSAVSSIAELTGGTAQYLERPEQAGEVYQNILNEMNQRYLVGYYPASPLRNGNRRSIKVRLRPGLDHKIHSRESHDGSFPFVEK